MNVKLGTVEASLAS